MLTPQSRSTPPPLPFLFVRLSFFFQGSFSNYTCVYSPRQASGRKKKVGSKTFPGIPFARLARPRGQRQAASEEGRSRAAYAKRALGKLRTGQGFNGNDVSRLTSTSRVFPLEKRGSLCWALAPPVGWKRCVNRAVVAENGCSLCTRRPNHGIGIRQ